MARALKKLFHSGVNVMNLFVHNLHYYQHITFSFEWDYATLSVKNDKKFYIIDNTAQCFINFFGLIYTTIGILPLVWTEARPLGGANNAKKV